MTNRSFSFSHYSTALRCLKLYEFEILKGERGEPTEHLLFGTAIHAGLHASLTRDLSTAYDAFSEQWKWVQGDVEGMKTRMSWGQFYDMGIQFIERFHERYAKDMEFVTGEKRFFGTVGGVKVEGTPDALVLYKGVPTLLDFKTTQYAYDKDKVLNSLQLNLYAELLKQNGFDVQQLAYFCFVKGTGAVQKPIIEPLDEAHKEAMLHDMASYIERLNSIDTFPRNPNNCYIGMNKCPHFAKCFQRREE